MFLKRAALKYSTNNACLAKKKKQQKTTKNKKKSTPKRIFRMVLTEEGLDQNSFYWLKNL